MGRSAAWDAELYEARHSFVYKFGEELIQLLNPQPGERILDVGCGPGQLSARIAECGAQVLGLDASPDMIGQARQNYPNHNHPTLKFVLKDAAQVEFREEFDAIFSNAALHWMLDMSAVAKAMAQSLRPGGRLVAELGGKGNIHTIENAIEKVFSQEGHLLPASRTVFPSISEYSSILEGQQLEVRSAALFDRPTLLEGDMGMANWLRQFANYRFEDLTSEQRASAIEQIVAALRPALYRDGNWYADYRRLRITAQKL
jgi:trans-aconitate methyltransferase